MAERGKYKTKQYDLLLAYLKTIPGRHVTVSGIHDHFKELGTSIGTTTIYRQLDRMMDEGLVQKYIAEPGMPACFAYVGDPGSAETEESYHFQCEKCGRLIHMHCDKMPLFGKHIFEEHDFMIDPMRTIFYGICESCLESGGSAARKEHR